jgi:hypothetical protein
VQALPHLSVVELDVWTLNFARGMKYRSQVLLYLGLISAQKVSLSQATGLIQNKISVYTTLDIPYSVTNYLHGTESFLRS